METPQPTHAQLTVSGHIDIQGELPRASGALPDAAPIPSPPPWWKFWGGPAELILARATVVLAVATLLLAIVAVVQTLIAERAAGDAARAAAAAEHQAAAAVAANRPWIKPHIEASFIDVGEKSIQVSILVASENIGHLPAEDIYPAIKSFPSIGDISMGGEESSISKQRDVCEESKAQYSDIIKRMGVGSVVFPNDASNMGITSSVAPEAVQQARRTMLHGTFGESDYWTTFTAVGCVLYRFTGSNQTHQTGVIAHCGKNDNGVALIDIRKKGKFAKPDVLCKSPFATDVTTSAD